MIKVIDNWSADLPKIPEDDLTLIRSSVDPILAEAACCFFLFRFLHMVASSPAVLMGDYCFGRFSAHLADIDNVELTNAFASLLKNDCLHGCNINEYIDFLKMASRII